MGNYSGEYERYYRNLPNRNNKYHAPDRGYGRGNKKVKSKGSFFSTEYQIRLLIKQLAIVLILILAYIGIKFINVPQTEILHTYVTNALEYNQDFSEYIDKVATLKWSEVENYATETYIYVNDRIQALKSQ